MTETSDDPIASWRDRVGTLRKRGRVGAAALTVVPAAEIDVRVGRPRPPNAHPTMACPASWYALASR